MTTVIAWIGADSRGPASLYLASDSRLSWEHGAWDYGRKLFAARRIPHLFGYCGDVLFPTQALSRITELMDAGILFPLGTSEPDMVEIVGRILVTSLAGYPSHIASDCDVIYGMRQGEGIGCTFLAWRLAVRSRRLATVEELSLPSTSGLVTVAGSGASHFLHALKRWNQSDVGGTSRAVFSALSDHIASDEDPRTGGPPQLVALHRQRGGLTHGVVWRDKRYYFGTELPNLATPKAVRWHNALFEIADPDTGQRAKGAQQQPRPGSLDSK